MKSIIVLVLLLVLHCSAYSQITSLTQLINLITASEKDISAFAKKQGFIVSANQWESEYNKTIRMFVKGDAMADKMTEGLGYVHMSDNSFSIIYVAEAGITMNLVVDEIKKYGFKFTSKKGANPQTWESKKYIMITTFIANGAMRVVLFKATSKL